MGIAVRGTIIAAAASLALVGGLGAGVVSAATSAATAPAAYASTTITIDGNPTVNGLRLRTGPGTSYPVRGLLNRSDVIRINIDQLWKAWYKVTLVHKSATGLPAGTTGYIAAQYFD